MRSLFGDMTAFYCLMLTATLEGFIQSYMIQSNMYYIDLFHSSTLGAQITDKNYRLLLASNNSVPVAVEDMKASESGPVLLDGRLRLFNARIKAGHVLWTDDVSELLAVLEELREVRSELSDERDIIAEEYRIKEKKMRMEELDRIYNDMQRETEFQIGLLAELLDKFEVSVDEAERINLLKKAAVIGAYIKRRNNLLLNAARQPNLPVDEIAFTFRDTIENLELFGVSCVIHSELSGRIAAEHLKKIYDFFEEITERSLDCMSVINGHLEKTEDGLIFVVTTDSAAELSCLNGGQITAERDEDGEWQLVLRLLNGGEKVCVSSKDTACRRR